MQFQAIVSSAPRPAQVCLKHLKEAQLTVGKAFPCSAPWLFQKAEGREFPVTGGSKLPCWDGGMSHVPGELGGPGRFQGLSGSAILNLCSLYHIFP